MATHEKVVRVLTKIYTLLIAFGYVNEADMRWAPHSPSELDRDLCRKTGLHDSAISLLENIPWAISHQPLTPHAPLINWSDESAFPASRYPTFEKYYQDFKDELAGEALEGQFVPLAFGEPSDKGLALVIDTQQGTAKEVQPWETFDRMDSHDAGELLESIYQKFVSLEYIPVINRIIYQGPDGYWRHTKAKTALLEYGWPDEFRKDDWVRDIDRLAKKWEDDSRRPACAVPEQDMGNLNVQDSGNAGGSQKKAPPGREL